MSTDEKNRIAVRRGYLLPVEMWVDNRLRSVHTHSKSVTKTGVRYKSVSRARNRAQWSSSSTKKNPNRPYSKSEPTSHSLPLHWRNSGSRTGYE